MPTHTDSAQEPDVLRIGIVGTGFLAETRLRCWARVSRADVVGVVSKSAASSRAFCAAYTETTLAAYEHVDALFSDPKIDVIDVCVPNSAHREIVLRAAAANKHIICTKPLTAYCGPDGEAKADPREMARKAIDDANTMVSAAETSRVFLCYAENWIYSPSILRTAQLLDESDAVLLEMRGGESHSGSHSTYAKTWAHTGGGALLRLGSHAIGSMIHLKRREGLRRRGRAIRPVAVRADVADLTQVDGFDPDQAAIATGWVDVENWGQVTIEFDDGSRGVAWGSDNRLGGMRSELTLSTDRSTFECNLSPTDQIRAYAASDAVYPGAYLIEKQSTTAGWSNPMTDEDWSSGQLGMCQAFADGIRRGEGPESDGSLGAEVVRVVYAAYVSADSGVRVALDSL